jgi:hypothetical protein
MKSITQTDRELENRKSSRQAAEKMKSGRRGSCSCAEMGNRPDSAMVKPKIENEQREEIAIACLRSKSN